MRKLITRMLAIVLALICLSSQSQAQSIFGAIVSPTSMWTDLVEKEMVTSGTRYIFPSKYRSLGLDYSSMRTWLAQAPHEANVNIANSSHVLALPMPEGGFEHFRIVYSPIMEPGLEADFPEIKTYAGHGVEDPTAYIRLDATPQGFHAMILRTGKSAVYIDPYAMGDTRLYISYLKKSFQPNGKVMTCDVDGVASELTPNINNGGGVARYFGDCQLRTYRLALAATGEYTTFHGGTVALAQAAQVTTMNRVNGVYEREMAVRLNIVANNNLLIYTNAGTDPYTNGTPGTMITQNQTNCTNVIGTANYDIGHVFGTNSGGLAGLGVVCNSTNKARGVTGSAAPVGDPFDIDYVAHEMGHQFGANHTFNSNQGACSGNQNNGTAMETGSGTTVMAYAGICGTHDVQSNSDDYFHAVSLYEIYTFIVSGGGASCDALPGLANNQPAMSGLLTNYTIPRSTPFVLTAPTTTDANSDPITYCWEQYDNQTNTQPPVATNTGGPQFRSRPPVTSRSRYFPRLSDLAAGTVSQWEVLPSVTRNMKFALVVRDNHVGGGCNDNDTMTVRVLSTSGPFVVTAPNTAVTWAANSTQAVTWNVANTTVAPINAGTVDIFLSTDGGLTFPTLVVGGVANTGSFNITVPNMPTTTARIMVKATTNIFFDISDVNFTITAPSQDYSFTPVTTNQAVCAPTNAVYTVTCNSIGGYTGAVTLSATNVPAGGTATFSPNPVTPGNNFTMTISGTGGITPGSYTITINGNATSGVHTTTVGLTVASGAPAAVTLSSPANAATNVSTTATFSWVAQGGTTYDIQIATDAGFTNIVRSATGLGTNSYVPSPALASSTTYYWRVRAVSGCGTGAYSTVRSFTTDAVTCHSKASTNVVTISATGTPIVYDSIYFPIGGTVTDVNVTNMVGTHTWISDLRVTLISPTGVNVVLWSGLCTDQDNFNIKFDDAGAAYNTIGCPMTGGLTYHPSGNLSSFNGITPTGWWKIKIEDLFNQDGGQLTTWTLEVCANNACIMTANISNNTPVSCFGGTNGAATGAPVGGGGPFTYLWSNGSTNATISNLTAGSYVVTVTDSWGCAATATATVQQPNVLQATATPTATTCGQANGSTTSSVTGGTAGYTYLWSNGATTSGLTNVASGSYTLTVTDTRGCTATASANIGSSSAVVANASSNTPASCGQSNGTATAAPSGGTGNYTYAWSNGGNSQTIIGLAAGSYTVTVTSGSCTGTGTVIVQSTGNITSSPSNVQHTTCGLNNGSASVTPSGGTVYTYLWSNGATTQTITGLAPGTYTVTVTDVTTCTSTSTVTINASSGVATTIPNFTHTSCGLNNGVASAVATGGTPSYTYLWSDGQTTAVASNLAAGTYTVTVSDVSGCTGTSSVTINGSSAPSANIFNTTGTSCGQNNGVASAVATGGTPGYTYLWSDGQTTAVASNLAAGSYTVTVTDAAGCTTTASTNIASSTAPTASISGQTNVSCDGGNDGSATATASNGTTPYTYLWSNGGTSSVNSGLAAGTYTVTVTDGAGCTSTASATITQPTSLSGTGSSTDESAPGASDGSATVAAAGGTSPYTYLWSNGGTTATINGVTGGTYTCTITDANGCTSVVTVTVNTIVAVDGAAAMGIQIFPNPSEGSFFVQYDMEVAQDLEVVVYNKLGQRVWAQQLPNASTGTLEVTLSNAATGVYSVEFRTEEAVVTKKMVIRK